jgi:hypothetical protein
VPFPGTLVQGVLRLPGWHPGAVGAAG